jgi:hypothetical protein
MGALAFAVAALQAAPAIVAAGLDLAQYVEQQTGLLTAMQAEGRDPTAEEWAALRQTIGDDTAALAQAAKVPLA